jgi:hypothetical protein
VDYFEEEIKKIIVSGLRYILSNQKDDPKDTENYGGISPYPEARKMAGVLATADTLTAIFRIIDLNLFNSKTESILKMEVNGKTVAERTKMAIDFLLKSQILEKGEKIYDSQIGGFPPKGDIYGIKTISFSDATSIAILSLLQAYKNVDKLYINKNNIKNYRNLIQNSIELAVNWLLKNFTHELIPTYNVPEENKSCYDKRSFPLVLMGMAFSILKSYGLVISDKNKIEETLETIKNNIRGTLENQKCIPFKFSGGSLCSFVSTSLGLQLLKWEENYYNEYIIDFLNIEAKKWYKEWQTQKSYRSFTDFDEINTSLIIEYLPVYNATYFRLPPIILLQVGYVNKSESIKERIKERIGELLSIAGEDEDKGFCYFYEDRGGAEKATSATASAIMALAEYLSCKGG